MQEYIQGEQLCSSGFIVLLWKKAVTLGPDNYLSNKKEAIQVNWRLLSPIYQLDNASYHVTLHTSH